MLEWHWWNWINVFFVFANGWFAIELYKEGNDFGGNVNMAAFTLNAWTVANILTS